MKTKTSKKAGARKVGLKQKGRRKHFPNELKLKIAQLHVNENVPVSVLSKKFSISLSAIARWAHTYAKQGEAAFIDEAPPAAVRSSKLGAVRDAIVAIKQKHPAFGTRRISDMLKRFFYLPGSPKTVRRTLQAEEIVPPPMRKKPKRQPKAPRRFERSRPNQMWQSDIHQYLIGRGEQVYFIGYIDDCSRYMVSLDVFTTQTAANVIGGYRKGRMEHGAPQEMLTDNGRQYTAWRGKTDFERELAKDRVHHIKSQPHHPMTLGKIERFWKTLDEEFLARTTFENFDALRLQLQWWIQFYNFKRPHQGLEGICPADRYFGMESETRRVMSEAIAENIEQLALNGKPREPFVMIGRMGDQTVTVEARRGQVRMLVDGKNQEEYTYNLKGDNGNDGHQGSNDSETTEQYGPAPAVQRVDEITGDPECVDGETQAAGGVSRIGDPLGAAAEMGESGDGRDADGAVTAASDDGHTRVIETGGADAYPADESAARDRTDAPGAAFGEHYDTGQERDPRQGGQGENDEVTDGQETESSDKEYPGSVAAAVGDGLPRLHRADDGPGGGAAAGGESEDLLCVGTESSGGVSAGSGETPGGASSHNAGSGERIDADGTCGITPPPGGAGRGVESRSVVLRVQQYAPGSRSDLVP